MRGTHRCTHTRRGCTPRPGARGQRWEEEQPPEPARRPVSHTPALSARLTFANPKCRATRNKLTPHLAEQNAKQADKCSAFQKVIVHFVNQIDFQILKPFFLKEVTEQAWEGAESRTVCHPSDGSGVVLTRTQADPVHTSASLWETPPQRCCQKVPLNSPLQLPRALETPGWLPTPAHTVRISEL